MPDWSSITDRIREATGKALNLTRVEPAAGGCINAAAVLHFGAQRYFVKYNNRSRTDMFSAEAEGLTVLAHARAIRVPAPVSWGVERETAYLVLEYLQMGISTEASQEALGRQLAALHRVTQPRFGWHRDNTIGSTPQSNTLSTKWVEFFRDRRLGAQLRLAAEKGYHRLSHKGERLLERLEVFFLEHAPAASLLHGDLWSGNAGTTADGEVVVFDPAVYYGDRETDLAMTELFGGFSKSFYAAYMDAWPLAPGYEVRRTLYNLYHILNHLNLFGGGYLAQGERMIEQLLAEVR